MATYLDRSPDQTSLFSYRNTRKRRPSRKQKTFCHTPLRLDSNNVRLIAVVPWPSDDGFVQCEMEEFTMDSKYTCLSYVWGSQSDMRQIKVNGRNTWVGENLFQFLTTASRFYHNRFFWIDALSINQYDVTERNKQVQRMGQIYSQAEMVFAWLGAESEVQKSSGWGEEKRDINLMCLEYWTRAWITQEMLLARKLQLIVGTSDQEMQVDYDTLLGSGKLDTESFAVERMRWLMANGSPIGTTVAPLLSRDPILHKKSLLDLLCINGWKKCSEDVDRVYSLLSLSKEGGEIRVDYGQSKAQLAHQVLRASTCPLCFCNVAILARALNLRGEEVVQTDTQETKWSQHAMIEFSNQSDRVVRDGRCSVCGVGIGSVRDGSRIVCLQSFCGAFDGHLVWRTGTRKEQRAETALPPLPVAVDRVESADGADPQQTYRWQLSLGALLCIIYAREDMMGAEKVYKDCEDYFQLECSHALRYSDDVLEQSKTEVRAGDRIALHRKQTSFSIV